MHGPCTYGSLTLQKTAQQAGMPREFLELAERTLLNLEAKDEARTALETKHGLGDRLNQQ